MDLKNKLSQTFRTGSITFRFSLGVGLLVALIVTVALTGYLSIFHIRHAENAIRTSTDIRQMVLEMDRGMERARRLHADFFLQYPAVGLSAAHELYAQPSVRQIAKVITISRSLKNLLARSAVSAPLRESRVDLNLYLSSAKRFADTSIQSVELVTELAAPERGLEALLNAHMGALQTQVSAGPLENTFHHLHSHVQNYLISRKRFLMQSAFNKAFEMSAAMARDPRFSDEKRRDIETLLDRMKATAIKIMAVDVAIKSKFNDFALQAKAVEPVSTALIQLSNAEVRSARARIEKALNTAMVIMAVISLAGLALATWIARFLSRSITRRIVRLTNAANELQQGRLDVFEQEQGSDELSQLARTFNLMAARIKGLIHNLERKVEQRTAELAESESRFRDLFEHSTSGVAVYEPVENGENFVFKDANKAVESIEQVSREQIIGKKVTDVFPGVAEFGLLDVFRRVARTGEAAHHPVSFYSDGRLKGWRENSIYRLPGGEIVAVYDDLTAQKKAEMEKRAIEEHLRNSQKMEAIGVLAGGVAHDFNNILSIILGNTELAIVDIPESSRVSEKLNEIRTASLRAKEVIRQLLSFSRKSDTRKEPVFIVPLIKESLTLMRASIPANIEIRENISNGNSAVLADPTQIHQVMINLCTNAAHAMEATGGVLQVDVTNIRIAAEDAALYPDAEPGPYVQVTIGDTGCGISPDLKDRIFDPYFTTKEIGKGSGMGLAVVHGIVKNHGGTISVCSDPGTGSAFNVLLPVTQDPVPAAKPRQKTMPGGSERVLLIDDESTLLTTTGSLLEHLGYHVVSTTAPLEALEMFRSDPDQFDVVITDMTMPNLTGFELSEKMLRIRSTTPIILCSGYSDTINARRARAAGIRKYLKKPFKMHQLAAAVREVLNEI